MKIRSDNEGIILEEVYSGVQLKTRDGETIGICMRDTGFEFNYNGTWYSAQKGIIIQMGLMGSTSDEDQQLNGKVK